MDILICLSVSVYFKVRILHVIFSKYMWHIVLFKVGTKFRLPIHDWKKPWIDKCVIIDFHIFEYIFCIAKYFILIGIIQTKNIICMDQVEFNLKLRNLGTYTYL